MLATAVSSTDFGHAIQLALAPVFLLTGIAGVLNVMTGRLGRIIDRGRQLSETPESNALLKNPMVKLEYAYLERRRSLASTAVTASTLSAFLICSVIVALFMDAVLTPDMHWVVGVLFTAGILALVAGLAFFLIEVRLANKTVRIPPLQS